MPFYCVTESAHAVPCRLVEVKALEVKACVPLFHPYFITLREVITFHKFVSSRTVLAELERVLKEKFKVPEKVCKEVLDFLGSNIVLAEGADKQKLLLSDESDILIVSEAVTANVDVLITGDKEIIALRQVEGMRIFPPREFWEFLRLKNEEIP